MLRVTNAAFRHPNGRGIEGLTFTVAPGEAVALIGPNGAGKSTLFAGLLGLLPLAQGSMTIGPDGTPPPGYIGYLPQHTTIEPDFPITLYQVVLLGRVRQFDYRLWPGRRDREAARAALRTTGLLPLRRERFGALSGGQRQRGLLARALVGAPRLLLLDEPFNGLDQTSRRELSATLNALKAEGVGLLIATHDFALARTACDTALLVNGRQLGHGPVTGVLTAEGLPAEFLHAHPHGTVPDGTLVPEPGTHPEAAGSPESATVLEPGTPIQDVLEPPRTVAAALPNPPE